MHILIIEDDFASASFLKTLLAAEHEVKIARSELEALETIADWTPELIISDWDLKEGGDGITACRKILKVCPAKIIFTSGFISNLLIQTTSSLHPAHIMSKPIDVEKLCVFVNQLNSSMIN